MPNMTLSVDAKTLERMRAHPEIRWSEVARQAFEAKLQRLKVIDELDAAFSNSTLTQKDADRLGREAKKRWLKELGW